MIWSGAGTSRREVVLLFVFVVVAIAVPFFHPVLVEGVGEPVEVAPVFEFGDGWSRWEGSTGASDDFLLDANQWDLTRWTVRGPTGVDVELAAGRGRVEAEALLRYLRSVWLLDAFARDEGWTWTVFEAWPE